jgi:alpha-L-glutamate ligase-like protein
MLGLNRRNQDFVFRYNARDRLRLADDKVATKKALSAAGIAVPRTYTVFEVPWDVRRLSRAVRRLDEFVLKPARSSGGGGVLVVVARDGERFLKASGEALTIVDLEDHVADVVAGAFSRNQRYDSALLEARVHSHPVIDAISFRGVADVRVLVFLGVPVLAMLRVPTRRSDGRANLHMGGIGLGVDLATGTTTRAIGPGGDSGRHPDLGMPLVGVRLPAWNDVLEVAARSADALGLGYFGADVVVDADLGPLVLELNGRPGLGIQLANRLGLRPLLEEVERRRPERLSVGERVTLGRDVVAEVGPATAPGP